MPKNKNILLLITIIALGLIVWGLSRQASLNEKIQAPSLKFSSKIDRIEIKNQELTIVLMKKDDNWFVQDQEINYPANTSAIQGITSTLTDFKIAEIVSKNPEKLKNFQIDDESALKIKWFKGDEERGKLFFGKSDYSRQGDYVRIGDSQVVYITQSNVKFNFSRPEFKDLNMLQIEQDKIKQIAWNYGQERKNFLLIKKEVAKETLTLPKPGDLGQEDKIEDQKNNKADTPTTLKWFLQSNNTEKQIDDSKINPLLSQISNINAKNILVKEEEKDYGVKEPFLQLIITNDDDSHYTLTIGEQADEEPAYYSQISNKKEWIYLLNIAFVNDNLAKEVDDFAADGGEG